MDQAGMTRRDLVLAAAVGGLGMLLPACRRRSRRRPDGWLGGLGANASARALGEVRLELRPSEGDADTLLRLLGVRAEDDEAHVFEVLRKRFLDDCRSGAEEEVLGWSLTVTEARLYALAASI